MSTASLYYDDKITPNQHDELTLFLGHEELSRKTSLVDMSDFDMNSVLHGCHLYCVDNCHANTYIQNIIKDETLPKYDRTNMCFVLINEKEESFKVSSIIYINKLGYVEKLPFKPLCNTPATPWPRPVTPGSSLGSLDCPHRPTLVFPAHFVLARAHQE
jgi:hypothetical protein